MRQKEFFSRQTPEIQELMASMAITHTSAEILDVLTNHDVAATNNHIHHYRWSRGIKVGRYARVVPADTQHERVGQYIAAIRELDWEMWKNLNLGCRCAAFARCATVLCNAGMIEKVEGYRPVKYTRCVTDDEMDAWYAKEMGEC